MTAVLGLVLPSGEEMEERIRREGKAHTPPPSFFEGLGSAVITAPLSGIEKMYRFATDPWGKQGSPLHFELDLETTGWAGQFIHTLLEDMTIYASGSLGPVGTALGVGKTASRIAGLLAIASAQGHQETEQLRKEGVSESVAMIGGAVSGSFHSLGFVLPFTRADAPLINNMARGMVQQGASHIAENISMGALLRSQGYEEQAKYYDQWDRQSLTTNAVLGGFFGLIGHASHVRSQSAYNQVVDKAFALKEHEHRVRGMASGIPKDGETSRLHHDIIDRSTERFHRGEKLDISQQEADVLSNGMIADEARLDPELRNIKEEPPLKEEAPDLMHDIDAPKTVISEIVPEGDVALARFEQQYPEAGKEFREETIRSFEAVKEWQKLLATAVDCHLS